ncbi:MAG: hypothetical protein Q8P67_21410 [archaeon]|nr:hypothetical protein [archaeon]
MPVRRGLSLSNGEIKECLRELRKWNLFFPAFTRAYAPQLLETSWGLVLGAEKWTVLEQLFAAHLEAGDAAGARGCLGLLEGRFRGSRRVALLHGLLAEAEGRGGQAEALYADLLGSDGTDEGALKREVALHKAANQPALAIEALTRYLGSFMADVEAWKELASLYLGACRFRQAAFCLEEVLLCQPENFHFFTLYADALFSQGSAASLLLARDYYLHALNVARGQQNLRAALGLLFSCRALDAALAKAPAKTSALSSRADNQALLLTASHMAHAVYLQHQPSYLVDSPSALHLSKTRPSAFQDLETSLESPIASVTSSSSKTNSHTPVRKSKVSK